jgi:hypothetical protein
MLSTPLISKNKNKLRASNEFKYKLKEFFESIKNRCKSKNISDYFYFGLTGIVCFH